jgi:hypothetical protein
MISPGARSAASRSAIVRIGSCGMHRGQHVELDVGCTEMREASHHLIEAAAPAPGHSEGVVEFVWPVDRDPNQEIVGLEELGPLCVELCAVGLARVLRVLPRFQGLGDQVDRAAEKLHPHQRWLAALPRDLHDRNPGVRLDQLPDVGLEQLVRHPEAAARVQHLLG